ncbi:MAG: hypothetical protein ACJ8EJ_06000, partial [Xanthobacteraceae bacterium]
DSKVADWRRPRWRGPLGKLWCFRSFTNVREPILVPDPEQTWRTEFAARNVRPLDHSPLRLAALMIGPHNSTSAFMRAPILQALAAGKLAIKSDAERREAGN